MAGKRFSQLILFLGLLMLVHQFAFYGQEASRIPGWMNSGELNSSLGDVDGEDRWVFTHADPVDFPGENMPAQGDTLILAVTAAGDTIRAGGWGSTFGEPGEAIDLRYLHEGETFDTELIFGEREFGDLFFAFLMEILRFLITVGFLGVGIWALIKRPDVAGVRALALFSFSMSALMVSGVNFGITRFPAAYEIPGEEIIGAVLNTMVSTFGAFWLNLQLFFPRALDWVSRRSKRVHLALYLPQVVLVVDQMVEAFSFPAGIYAILLSLQVAGGFAVLFTRRAKEKEPLARRQLSLVTWGSGLGLGMLFLLMLIFNIPGFRPLLPSMFVSFMLVLIFLALLLSPISFAFAFGRYRLLEVEGRLHRGTRHILVTGALLALFFALLYVASEFLLGMLGAFDIGGRQSTLAVALVMALGFSPLHRRVQNLFETRIYPERGRLREILDRFHTSTASMADRDSLFRRLEESLNEGLGITAVVPAMWDEPDATFLLPGREKLPFSETGQLMRTLRDYSRPLLVDELCAAEKIVLGDDELHWLQARHVGVILPMRTRGKLIGLLFLVTDEAWEGLGVASLEELIALGSQVALECENLSLLEQTLDKRRLEEQLAMARRVQEGFLPKSLPETPGLDLAATYQSSLEVAGDYYDVLSLPDGRTLMAVGDVSGKGAGAAMIMANLQAALRSMARVGVPLGEMVGGINDIIHANTPVEQFITFFAAAYDPSKRELTFVNAGHNPPRVVGADDSVSDLDPVGPILGVFPGLEFGEQTVTLKPGDLLITFTDGVSEAMNAAGDDFGEEAIVEAVMPHRNETPERLLTVIRESVDAFRGETPLGDDYTLVVARVEN